MHVANNCGRGLKLLAFRHLPLFKHPFCRYSPDKHRCLKTGTYGSLHGHVAHVSPPTTVVYMNIYTMMRGQIKGTIYSPYTLAQPFVFPYTLGCMVARTTIASSPGPSPPGEGGGRGLGTRLGQLMLQLLLTVWKHWLMNHGTHELYVNNSSLHGHVAHVIYQGLCTLVQ